MNTTNLPRRKFLAASVSALGLAPMAWLRAQSGPPNDEILMGVIGCGNQGVSNMKNFLGMAGVRVVAVCDVDANMMANAKKLVDERYQNQDCKMYARHTDLLAHPGLQAISMATPDHWHAKIGIDCANAGMDIYGEKPLAWGLAEGRALVESVKKNKRIWQTGSWQRSSGEFRRFRALIQNNTLGKLTRFECGTPSGMSIFQHLPEDQWDSGIGKPPAHLDWKAYCGPAGEFAYHPMIHPWNWRWLNRLGGGQLLDWVGHHVDIALWTLGLDHTGPVKVEGTGEQGNHKVFDTYVKYSYQGTFADGRVMEVRSDFGGVKFTGENGWIHVDRGRLEASDPAFLRNLPDDYDPRIPNHSQDFIDCICSRKQTVAHAEAAHRAASFGQLGIVAIDTKQPVLWDPENEKVTSGSEQAAHARLGSRLDS